MQIEIKLDENCKEPKIIVVTVFAETNHGEYTLRLRLYEMEQRLDSNFFVRISNSDIINLRKVKGFDLSFAGTICVTLSNGTVTYVSRRFVAKIKQLLGI